MNCVRVSLPLLGLLAGTTENLCAAAPTPPNIVLILSDDMGYGDKANAPLHSAGLVGPVSLQTSNLLK